MDEILRTFLALELKPDVQQAIGRIQNRLGNTGADVKWVKPHNIHLTIKFLGDTPTSKLQGITDIIKDVVQPFPCFDITLTHLGAFPKIERPQVLWLGLEKGKDETIRLAETLEETFQRIGFAKEKRGFSPHVTIGRLRSSVNQSLLAKTMRDFHFPSIIPQSIERLAFFKSTLTPQGPIYQIIQEFILR